MTTDPSDNEFVRVRRSMFKLDLPLLSVLVLARIDGFCRSGSEFYESRAATADFFDRDPSQITKAINRLVDVGLIEQTGLHVSPRGSITKSYRTTLEGSRLAFAPEVSSPLTKHQPPDIASSKTDLNPDGTSGEPVTGCHPIRKGIRKPYG